MFKQKCSGVTFRHALLSPVWERNKVRGNVVAGFILLALVFNFQLSTFSFQLAAAEEYELGTIVITAEKGQERNILSVPANITVITSDDIAASDARTIADLLRSEAGLVVRDMYGNGGQASVDIRGFGEAAGMNCVILIDGRRVNNIDISNPDISQVSLAQVEKIEVLRGGAGVLYGDNAAGGVINIITKKSKERNLSASFSANAFSGTDVRFGLGNAGEKYSYSVSGSYRFSGGFRQHSGMWAGDLGASVEGKGEQNGPSWDFSTGLHYDRYDLPGPIDQLDWDSGYCWKSYIWGGWPFGPIKSTVPVDNGASTDWFAKLALKKDFGKLGTETEISMRNRNARSFIDSWGMYDSRYTTVLGAGEKLSYSIIGIDLLGGIEFYGNSYRISPETVTGAPTAANDDQRVDRNSTALYLQVIAPFLKVMSLEAGGRVEGANHYIVGDAASFETFRYEILDALYAGFNVRLFRRAGAFVRWSKSYRMPKTDEYYAWGVYNSLLKPQRTEDVECGVKYAGSRMNAALSLFTSNSWDEIYYHSYSPPGWDPRDKNENYPDPVVRTGCEAQVGVNIFEFASVSVAYTFTDARFGAGTGVYTGKYVPLVPTHKGDINLSLSLPLGIIASVDCAMVSDRFFGTDYDQTGARLPGYTIVDVKARREFGRFTVFGAVTNVGDTKYAETAYAGTYYPSPPRNFSVGVDINLGS